LTKAVVIVISQRDGRNGSETIIWKSDELRHVDGAFEGSYTSSFSYFDILFALVISFHYVVVTASEIGDYGVNFNFEVAVDIISRYSSLGPG